MDCFGVFNCVLMVKVITYNLLINPMYLNIVLLFISECLQSCVILENLFQLSLLHIILNNELITPNGSTPEGVLEVHGMFYYSGRV